MEIIRFFNERLSKIQEKLVNWWEFGEQEKPCFLATLPPNDPGGIPDTDNLKKWWTDIHFIINRQMRLIDHQRYLGQSVPFHYIDCSSSAMSGVLGARLELVNKDTMWAYPCFDSVEEVVEMALERNTFWYQHVRTLTEESVKLAKSHHFVSLFAMEGISDILAGLYGTENFLVDLVEKPREVARAAEHVKQIWIELFNEFQGLLQLTGNEGQIGWAGIWAPGSHFPMQEDFSYMISREMFRKFLLPHVSDMVDVMEYPLYHLDGIGALPHLPFLLQIPRLRAIQWVPGAGRERIDQWYEVINKILQARKSVQVFVQAAEVEELVENVGTRGLLMTVSGSEEELLRLADQMEAE